MLVLAVLAVLASDVLASDVLAFPFL